uniref:Uncharacterized protein n=1 Tax=Picea glauca TaxID=3330 RepID=A0A101LY33_PICGL|nr:hypothetical protein ABT39_MTgene5680 [Picea glauca]
MLHMILKYGINVCNASSFLQSIRGRNDCSVSESVVRGMGNSLSWVSHA